MICNPNNPTGTVCADRGAGGIPQIPFPEDVLLVMDEAYMEFATEPDCCSMVDYMKAHPEKTGFWFSAPFPNIMRWQCLRVGYALGSEEPIGIMWKCSASWNS